MQTFLPYPDFAKSASVLDYRRLGKQRVECKQLLSALGFEIMSGRLVDVSMVEGRKAGWVNHPATKMWRGYEAALAEYQLHMIMEWKRRGYNNTMETLDVNNARIFMNPPWLGDETFHASHRSNLLRKDPEFYGKYGWTEPHNQQYLWPTPKADGGFTMVAGTANI